MQEPVKLPLSHPMVSQIMRASFGADPRGRRAVRIECRSSRHYAPNWDGGSRTEAFFVRLSNMTFVPLEEMPHDRRPTNYAGMVDANVQIQPGICMVEHSVFQGKDTGYRIMMNAADIPTYLPEAISLIPKGEA